MKLPGSSGSSASAGHPASPPFPIIVSITLTGIMANTLITPAIPDIVATFGVGPSGAGVLLAAATAPGIVLAPVIGLLADRFGRKQVLLPCLAVFGFAGGLSALAPTFPVLVGLRLLQGIGSAGLINMAVTLIGDHWDGAERARMMGRNAAALTASIAVLPPFGGLLTAIGGWRLSFAPYWLGLLTALGILVWLPWSERRPGSLMAQLRATGPYLRNPVVYGTIGMAFVFFMLIFGVFLTALPFHLAHKFHMGAGGRGFVLGAPAVTSTATALNLGRLRARHGARRLLIAGSILLAVSLAVLAVAWSLPVLLAGPVIYGFGEGMLIPTLQDLVAGAAPAANRAAVVALFVGASRLGQTVGPVLVGIGLEARSAPAVFLVGSVLALGLVVAQLLIPVRRQELAGVQAN